jgi:prophage regulatory protein
MHHRRPTRSKAVRRQITAMDDLFAYAKSQAPQATDEELWSIKIVRIKTGLSRASVYNYIALGLFPRQRRIGPGRVAWRASEVRTWIEARPE